MKPMLLLLPGLSGTSSLMQWLTPYLETDYELCLIELPISQSPGDQSYENLCNYLEDNYLNKLKHQTYWVLAESFSGPIAVMLAHRYPQKIAGVILAATFITCPNMLAKKLKNLLFTLLPIRLGREIIGSFFLTGTDIFHVPLGVKKEIGVALSATPINTLKERLATVITCDLRSRLPLTQPVLYLQAARDWVVREDALRTIQTLQPDLKCLRLNAPHLILQIKPQEAAFAIQQFITENSQSS